MTTTLARTGAGLASVTGVVPAAAIITTDTDVDILWNISGVNVVWQASSTAGNRVLKLELATSDGSVIASLVQVPTLAEDLVGEYSWIVGGPVSATSVSVGTSRYSMFPLPDLTLPAGATITVSDTAAVDAADIVSINVTYNKKEPVQ